MTGTASSRGKVFMDFDSYKNQEWLRRRKLRLEQVRKQSNEIAKVLRQKVNNEEKRKLEEYERIREERFQTWKAERLEELERKLMNAFEGFGSGYKLAEEDSDQELSLEEKSKINLSNAQKRGEIAYQEELRKKKLAKEKESAVTERKKLTRKKEDLRSALVRTVPVKNQLIESQQVFEEEPPPVPEKITVMKKKIKKCGNKQNTCAHEKKTPVKKLMKKKVNQKSCACKNKATDLEIGPTNKNDTVWINLDEIQTSSGGESGPCLRNSKSTLESKKFDRGKSKGSVEFYDFSSRYYCRSFREYPHLVERIDRNAEEVNAHELARIEEEREKVETKKKSEVDAMSHGRGLEALRKERINRDYSNMMAKLEELSKKEKILKAQTRNLPSFLHMNDERLSERTKTRQRMMESKFESVYYEATSRIPPPPPAEVTHADLSGGGDHTDADDGPAPRLSFSPSNLKHNSPVTSSAESSSGASTLEPFDHQTWEKPNDKDQRQLLKNINRALKEGRKLRKTVDGKWRRKKSDGEEEDKDEDEEEEEEEEDIDDDGEDEEKVPPDGSGSGRISTKCQESQTEELNIDGRREKLLKGGDDSLPESSSTSYKSLPSVIRSPRLNQFLDYLEGLSEDNEKPLLQNNSKIRRRVNRKVQHCLEDNENADFSEEKEEKSPEGPTLEYYVEKLLDMSRECVANLSVSSENVSTPNITDLELESECPSRPLSRSEDLVRKSRLKRADMLETSVRNWKMILGKYSPGKSVRGDATSTAGRSEATDVVDSPRVEPVIKNSELGSKYEQITKKCSERILELSDMLEKVRKDKEKLLGSASGDSSGSPSRGDKSQMAYFAEEEVVPLRRKSIATTKTSPVLEGFINRYNLTRPSEDTMSTTAVADPQSPKDQSLESWPDVMDELLKREILTSPFKWSEGDVSELNVLEDSCTKPSSIESVIGNFRKEMIKIKPFAHAHENSIASPDCGITEKSAWPTGLEDRDFCLTRENGPPFREESSVESIDHYLTSLGLNWAKSFLRKEAETRAISSSSNSLYERKFSGDE